MNIKRQNRLFVNISRQQIQQWLRYDGIVILLYLLTLSVMSYPLIFKLGEIIPLHNPDTYTAMWQNWWLQQVITKGFDLNHTPFLFYPDGLDVTLQPRRWTSYPLWAVYNSLFGEPTAYNLTILTQSMIKAYVMYRFILLFVPDRPSAWVGGAFFAFSARILASGIQQPNTGSLEFIPIFMIFFVLALRRVDSDDDLRTVIGWMSIAGIMFSANIYMNLKIGIFAMLVGGLYVAWVFIVQRLWRKRTFWIGMIWFALVSGLLSAPILIPALTYENLDSAINQFVPDNGMDILSYLKPDLKQPMFYNQLIASFNGETLNQQVTRAFGHIGFASIILASIGTFIVLRKHRQQFIWVLMAFIFFGLSLGARVQFNMQEIEGLWTPYQALIDNPIFVALREPYRFQVLFIFAQAVLIAYAIHALMQAVTNQRVMRILIVILSVFMMYETSIFPIPYRSATVSSAYDYVIEHHQGPIISMPMGRQPAKYAMYNQIFHGQPIAEGMIARMPEDAYDYIEDNLLLRDMASINDITQASDDLLANWNTAIDDLLDKNFRYVVVHRLENTGTWLIATYDYQERMFFMEIDPVYETETAVVYDLQDLRDHPPQGDPFAGN